MSTFRLILRELAGLFVDDGNLALAILGVVALAAMAAAVDAPRLVTGGVIVAGCLLVLVLNVVAAVARER